MDYVKTDKAPKAIGPYSQGVLVDGFLFASGQIAINPETGNLVEGIVDQTNQVCNNISEILKSAGLTFENVIKTTVFIKDIKDFATVNEIYAKYFISNPARSCVEVSNLPKGALIEIEIIAKK